MFVHAYLYLTRVTFLTETARFVRLWSQGAQSEVHVLGEPKGGLSEHTSPEDRHSTPIGVVRAACKASKQTVVIGTVAHSVISLLGVDEVRGILAHC